MQSYNKWTINNANENTKQHILTQSSISSMQWHISIDIAPKLLECLAMHQPFFLFLHTVPWKTIINCLSQCFWDDDERRKYMYIHLYVSVAEKIDNRYAKSPYYRSTYGCHMWSMHFIFRWDFYNKIQQKPQKSLLEAFKITIEGITKCSRPWKHIWLRNNLITKWGLLLATFFEYLILSPMYFG